MRKRIKQFEIIVESQFIIVKLCLFALNVYTLHISNKKQLNFINKIRIVKSVYKARIITNIEISILNFVNERFVRLYKFFIVIFVKFIKLRLTNNKLINNITHITQIKFNLTKHVIEF